MNVYFDENFKFWRDMDEEDINELYYSVQKQQEKDENCIANYSNLTELKEKGYL